MAEEKLRHAEPTPGAQPELRQVHLPGLQRRAEPLELVLKLRRAQQLFEILRAAVLLRQVLQQPCANVLATEQRTDSVGREHVAQPGAARAPAHPRACMPASIAAIAAWSMPPAGAPCAPDGLAPRGAPRFPSAA